MQNSSDHLDSGECGRVQAPLTVGECYAVSSQRKGNFSMRLTSIDDTWATGVIVSGHASAMLAYNERENGEEVTVRREFCRFTPYAKATGASA